MIDFEKECYEAIMRLRKENKLHNWDEMVNYVYEKFNQSLMDEVYEEFQYEIEKKENNESSND